jgi:predicted DsbA family dithiol-disulfide isomerase
MNQQSVELLIDPACPWCWLTSLWLFEAERVRRFAVETKVFSLAEVNRAADDMRDSHNAGDRALRVLVAARRSGGEQAIRAVYRELGQAHHERGEPLGESATLEAAVLAAGLPRSLVAGALADETIVAEILSEHAAAIERGGFGVPSLSVDGSRPFFGPIVDNHITGEAAGTLWDLVAPLLVNPHVFELKRPLTGYPEVGRYESRIAAAAAPAE